MRLGKILIRLRLFNSLLLSQAKGVNQYKTFAKVGSFLALPQNYAGLNLNPDKPKGRYTPHEYLAVIDHPDFYLTQL